MKHSTRTLVIAATTAAGLAFTALTPAVAQLRGASPDADLERPRVENVDWRGGRGDRHGGMRALCGDRAGDRIERMIERGQEKFDFTADQQAAFDSLASTVRGAHEEVQETCETLRDNRGSTPPERMANMEAGMTAALSFVQDVRPAFETFYNTLSAEQQEELEDMMHHRGKRGGKRGGGDRN